MWSKIDPYLESAAKRYRVGIRSARALLIAPFAIVLIYGVLLSVPQSRPFAFRTMMENRPVELLTFGFLLLAGIRGLALARRARRERESWLLVGFYAVFSLLLLLVAMEEISWGQTLLGFKTPEGLRGLNEQGELTLHNLQGVSGHGEIMRIAFGAGGLAGVLVSFLGPFRKIGASPLLLGWFLVIFGASVADFLLEKYKIGGFLFWRLKDQSEVIEMMIGFAALMYVYLNARMLSAGWSSKA